MSSRSERIKRQLRAEYVRKDRHVKWTIKADKGNGQVGREGRKKQARGDTLWAHYAMNDRGKA